MAHKLAFIGFGGVGQGLASILIDKKEKLKEQYGTDFQVVSISDLYKGSIHDPEGLNLEQVLDSLKEHKNLDGYPESSGLIRGWDSIETIEKSNADTMIEITFTDVKPASLQLIIVKKHLQLEKTLFSQTKDP